MCGGNVTGSMSCGFLCRTGRAIQRRHLAIGITLLLQVSTVCAQEPAATTAAAEETDLPDLIRAWRHKDPPPEKQPGERMIVAAPVIGSNPSAGSFIGAAAQFARFRGDPSTTRITSGIASVTFST